MHRLNIKAFTIASGLIWGFGLFAFTWWRMLFGEEGEDDTIIARIYRGYSITPIGSVVGLAWGLLDGAACGAIFAWLYNRIAEMLPMRITI
jgi:hypothetical protein